MATSKETKVNASTLDVESASSTSNSSQEHVQKTTSTWKGYIWDTWDLPKDERWLLFKVDAFVLTFASVRYLPPVCLQTLVATNEALVNW